jgi:hypothetical protein
MLCSFQFSMDGLAQPLTRSYRRRVPAKAPPGPLFCLRSLLKKSFRLPFRLHQGICFVQKPKENANSSSCPTPRNGGAEVFQQALRSGTLELMPERPKKGEPGTAANLPAGPME